MSSIGENIKKLRTEMGITQEQLGALAGVTTQAVSRWERGGTPDAEILPHLSEILGVSIDALFGRDEQSFALTLARQLGQMPVEDAFSYAFSICWAIEIGLIGDISVIDDFMKKMIDPSVVTDDKKIDYFAKIIRDNGIANVRMSPGFSHFFLMVEPKDSLLNHLADAERLKNVFEIFADKNLLSVMLYVYSRSDTPVATSLISKSTGLTLKEVDRCMEILCQNNIATHTAVATADGTIHSYSFRKESFAIPLLCFADELTKQDTRPFLGEFKRKKPLL